MLQRFLVEFGAPRPGAAWQLTWTFMGVVKPAEFTADHAPAFVKGEPPKTFLCVYPFVRTPEWYLLPAEERGAAPARTRRDRAASSPTSGANTTSAFGLGDWEWILAFEADEADRLVDCIRRLRDAKARLFTKEEIPFITGHPQVGRRRASTTSSSPSCSLGACCSRTLLGVVGDVGRELLRRTDVPLVHLAGRDVDLRQRLRLPRDLTQ